MDARLRKWVRVVPGLGRLAAGWTVKVGDKAPSARVKQMAPDGNPTDVWTDALFKGRKVALFAVPGAFTPTCSVRHLPGYVEKAAELKAKGIDAIVCVSVNDAFVMDAWGKARDVGDKILMLGDGNGDFTRAMGLELDGTAPCIGMRSQRYSMVVDDGVITQLYIELPNGYDVSSADHMLKYL